MNFLRFSIAVAALGIFGCSQVLAQDSSLYFDPNPAPALTKPSYFEGLYAGVLTGVSSARHNNFFTSGAPLRIDASAVAGWGWALAPNIVASGELQASVSTDFFDASDFDVMAIGRLGVLSDSRFMTYAIGGVGYFADAPAWEAGLGYEWMASNNLSLRLEGVGIGQLGNVPNGNNIPGVSAVRLTSGAVWHFNGAPQGDEPVPAGPVTDFSGGYAGLYSGAWANPSYNFFRNDRLDQHLSRVAFGGIAGYNLPLAENIRVGAEVQGGPDFDSSGDIGVDALLLAHAGYVALPGLMPYAAAGVGSLAGKGAYALGGGVEYALWGQNSLRAEALGVGGFSDSAGISATKFTFGTLWHFN